MKKIREEKQREREEKSNLWVSFGLIVSVRWAVSDAKWLEAFPPLVLESFSQIFPWFSCPSNDLIKFPQMPNAPLFQTLVSRLLEGTLYILLEMGTISYIDIYI